MEKQLHAKAKLKAVMWDGKRETTQELIAVAAPNIVGTADEQENGSLTLHIRDDDDQYDVVRLTLQLGDYLAEDLDGILKVFTAKEVEDFYYVVDPAEIPEGGNSPADEVIREMLARPGDLPSVLGFGRGVDLIAFARQEQMDKHGFGLERDRKYKNNELIHAAIYLLTNDEDYWPADWPHEDMMRMFRKKPQDKLAHACAMVAAHIDAFLGSEDYGDWWRRVERGVPRQAVGEEEIYHGDPLEIEIQREANRKYLIVNLTWFMDTVETEVLRNDMMQFLALPSKEMLRLWVRAFNRYLHSKNAVRVPALWSGELLDWLKENYSPNTDPDSLYPDDLNSTVIVAAKTPESFDGPQAIIETGFLHGDPEGKEVGEPFHVEEAPIKIEIDESVDLSKPREGVKPEQFSMVFDKSGDAPDDKLEPGEVEAFFKKLEGDQAGNDAAADSSAPAPGGADDQPGGETKEGDQKD